VGLVRQAYLTAEGFDFARTVEEDIRFGYVVDLPFRIRLGELYRHKFTFRGKAFEIVLYNKYPIPRGTSIDQLLRDGKPLSARLTRALVLVRQPGISPNSLDNVRNWSPKEGETPPINPIGSTFAAMEALNHFVVAYATGAKQLFGGKPLRLFRTNDFFDFVCWNIAIFWPPDEDLSDDDCSGAFNIKVDREFISTGSFYGDSDDLQVDETRLSIDEHLRLQESFIHYELAFEAKSKMVAGDYIGALLLAVAALEGVHAAFVQRQFRLRLPIGEKDLPEEFIHELGMSLCNKITPYLLMEQGERPDPELISKAGHGLKMRNEIMHSLQNKRGEYRIRTRSNKEISDAYSAVLKVYEHYISALAKRVGQ
jgi:hypothetical protein